MFGTREEDWPSIASVLGAVLLAYYLVPIASLVLAQPPGAVLDRLGDADVVGAAVTSLVSAVVSTSIGVVLGVPLAYRLARTGGRVATVVTTLVVLPLVLPPVVSGLLLLSVVGPGTPVDAAARALSFRPTRSLFGVILAQTFVASPFVVLTSRAAFARVDRELEEAAHTMGATRLQTFRHVTLPLSLPGVLAGVTLAFARAMGEFGATLTVAYYPRTLPVQIWVSFSTRGLDAAYPIAVVLLGVSLAALAVLSVLGRLGSFPVRWPGP